MAMRAPIEKPTSVDQRPVLAGVDAEPADEHERITGPGDFIVDAHPVAVYARHALNIAARMRRYRAERESSDRSFHHPG